MTEVPKPESADSALRLPEKIGPADLEVLNKALGALFDELRFARSLPRGETHGRLGTVAALRATWTFLMCFEPVLAEALHAPLLNLNAALLALNQNNVAPLLKPTPASDGGRAPDSPEREALIGFAAGAVGQLRWTGMKKAVAYKKVADILDKLGIRPARGSGQITARTVREWCERVAADVSGTSIAAINANRLLSTKWRQQITLVTPSDAGKRVLTALVQAIRTLDLEGARSKKPVNPPT